MTAGDDVRRRERAFYDREAAERAPAEPPRPPDDYDRSLIAALQPLEGRRVLELGCGRGDLTLQLLDAGAEVTAVDPDGRVTYVHRGEERIAAGARVLGGVAPAVLDRLCPGSAPARLLRARTGEGEFGCALS